MKPTYKGVEYDSQEEVEFKWWLEEAKEAGLIYNYAYQPKPYKLSPRQSVTVVKRLKTKTKLVDKFLLHPHEYTADYELVISARWNSLKIPLEIARGDRVVIDVKGSYNPHGGDRVFALNQKWVYQQFNLIINKVVPEKLFKATWVPELARLSPKQKKPRAKYLKCKTVGEFLEL